MTDNETNACSQITYVRLTPAPRMNLAEFSCLISCNIFVAVSLVTGSTGALILAVGWLVALIIVGFCAP
jgi:hypothetical protein